MLTKTEKRFIHHWEEQRTGGKLAYVSLTSLAGTIILSLFSFVVLFFGLHVSFSWNVLLIVVPSSIVISVVTSIIVWHRSEKKYHQLVEKDKFNLGENGFE